MPMLSNILLDSFQTGKVRQRRSQDFLGGVQGEWVCQWWGSCFYFGRGMLPGATILLCSWHFVATVAIAIAIVHYITLYKYAFSSFFCLFFPFSWAQSRSFFSGGILGGGHWIFNFYYYYFFFRGAFPPRLPMAMPLKLGLKIPILIKERCVICNWPIIGWKRHGKCCCCCLFVVCLDGGGEHFFLNHLSLWERAREGEIEREWEGEREQELTILITVWQYLV